MEQCQHACGLLFVRSLGRSVKWSLSGGMLRMLVAPTWSEVPKGQISTGT